MKAVLLIDMPSNCYECPLRTQEFDLYYSHYACQEQYTTIHEKEGDVENIKKTCPLKQLPLKRCHESIIYANNTPYLMTNVFTERDRGWNDCIDEITGESEDGDSL